MLALLLAASRYSEQAQHLEQQLEKQVKQRSGSELDSEVCCATVPAAALAL